MKTEDLLNKFKKFSAERDNIDQQIRVNEVSLRNYQSRLVEILREQKLLEDSLEALKKVKPILAANSIEQCEKLANIALKTIFDTDATVKYSPEDGQFVIDEGEYFTSLQNGNGGGYLAVISLVFNIFLLLKMNKRLTLFFDEHFTQISDEYFYSFFEFLRKMTSELGVEVFMITHDNRVTEDMVDHLYVMEDGVANKIK